MARAGGTGTDRDARLRAALRANLARRKARTAAVASPQRGDGVDPQGETDFAGQDFLDPDIPEKD